MNASGLASSSVNKPGGIFGLAQHQFRHAVVQQDSERLRVSIRERGPALQLDAIRHAALDAMPRGSDRNSLAMSVALDAQGEIVPKRGMTTNSATDASLASLPVNGSP